MKCRPKTAYNYDCIQWNGDNYGDIVNFLGYKPDIAYLNVLVLYVMEGSSSVRRGLDLNGWLVLPKGFCPMDVEIVPWYDFEEKYELQEDKIIERCR